MQAFDIVLRKRFKEAHAIQAEFDHDDRMIEMLASKQFDHARIKSWMRTYGLFQGIDSASRDRIVERFIRFVQDHPHPQQITEEQIGQRFHLLLEALHQTVNRGWLSATSKLLWCLHPQDVVIFDAFVHRALVVLQHIDAGLEALPRIGSVPSLARNPDLASRSAWYMRYQRMVRILHHRTASLRDELRKKWGLRYPYDIRITDKVLWMMGDPNYKG